MNDGLDPVAPSPADPYSPRRRTALVLTGTGTAGAYHAGVLRALHEAGVKIDVVAGRGVGVIAAVFAAIDGQQRLWDDRGFWRSPAVPSFYGWRPVFQFAGWAIAACLGIVALPIAAVAAGAVVFPIDFVARLVGLGGATGLVGEYLRLAQVAFAPEGFPTWLPRLVVLALAAAAVLVAVAGLNATGRRRQRGAFWWQAMGPPLSSKEIGDQCWRVMWDLLGGAAPLKQPPAPELVRRYTDLLTENIGQPGFRELLIAVHDIDARRDLVFALVDEPRRRALTRRRTIAATEERRSEVFDLSGIARDHLADAVMASLAVPAATAFHEITFAADGYWRGETHRLCDRPGALIRLLDEVAELGVEQALVVSAASTLQGPHALAAGRLDGQGRLGEYLQSGEAAVLRDATRLGAARIPRIFTIHPAHNPIGPFDFGGGYDERSDRRLPLAELMSRGYEDAYRQFIEPVVGASGERVGAGGGEAPVRAG